MTTSFRIAVVVFAVLCAACSAFVPAQQQQKAILQTTTTPLFAAPSKLPEWDGDKWVTTSPDQEPSAGYGISKTLLLHGPVPFVQRLINPSDYEQGVLKFMAGDKVDRIEAQGNMDFYLNNPNDWAYNRLEMEKKGVKYDYTSLDTKKLILTLVWSSIVTAAGSNVVYSLSTGISFWHFLPQYQ